LTRCGQIGDEDIQLILQASDKLIILSLEECRGITDAGFYQIPKYNPRFTSLNLAITAISDQPLIELANQCSDLTTLDLTRCENITEKGVFELIRAARRLRELIIKDCDIPESALL